MSTEKAPIENTNENSGVGILIKVLLFCFDPISFLGSRFFTQPQGEDPELARLRIQRKAHDELFRKTLEQYAKREREQR